MGCKVEKKVVFDYRISVCCKNGDLRVWKSTEKVTSPRKSIVVTTDLKNVEGEIRRKISSITWVIRNNQSIG